MSTFRFAGVQFCALSRYEGNRNQKQTRPEKPGRWVSIFNDMKEIYTDEQMGMYAISTHTQPPNTYTTGFKNTTIRRRGHVGEWVVRPPRRLPVTCAPRLLPNAVGGRTPRNLRDTNTHTPTPQPPAYGLLEGSCNSVRWFDCWGGDAVYLTFPLSFPWITDGQTGPGGTSTAGQIVINSRGESNESPCILHRKDAGKSSRPRDRFQVGIQIPASNQVRANRRRASGLGKEQRHGGAKGTGSLAHTLSLTWKSRKIKKF